VSLARQVVSDFGQQHGSAEMLVLPGVVGTAG
jgi:hypothetical protein